jgi:hypothetical protein
MVAVYGDRTDKKLWRTPIISVDVFEFKYYKTPHDKEDDRNAEVDSIHVPMEGCCDKYSPIEAGCSNLLGYEFDGDEKDWTKELNQVES